ncbi:MAG TPA: hemolysin family protein [Candidatus Sumerlaeota bacterium]|nr:hemolysin family protein [Candidatus Sumerlaeota bacterium]
MSFGSFLLSFVGMLACFALGAMFSVMESFVLSLNRFRLLQFFADEHPEAMTEQQIFRETKDLYFSARLGMCLAAAGAGVCLFRMILYCLGPVLGMVPGSYGLDTLLVLSAGLTLLLLTPLLMAALGLPRFFSRRTSIESESDLPRPMQWLLTLTRRGSLITSFFSDSFMAHLLPGRELSKGELVTLATDLELDEEEETQEEPEEAEPGEGGEEEGEEGEEESEETDEEEIIYNILDLDDTLVREVMRPINTVVAIRLGAATVADVRNLARRTGYSRFPVYREGIVDLTGFVSIYDILNDLDDTRSLETYVQPAYYVPEFMCVRALLWEFRNRNLDAAVVVDEHGGSSGWVTREDVLEEIVGAVEDEFDDWRGQFEKCEDGSYLVDGALHIDDVADQLDLEFDDDPEYDTLAGYLLMTLGRIPVAGERVESEKALYVVERMERNRIAQVRISLKKPDAEDAPVEG